MQARINCKLATWKGRLLNKPGRVTLANSVLAALPSYNMEIYKFPYHICDKIDSSIRRFIWKGSSENGMHMVGWDKITQARKHGGLGVRRSREHKVALIGKLVWNLYNHKEKLWVQVLDAKYLKPGHLNIMNEMSTGSSTWNAIRHAFEDMQECFHFKVGCEGL